MSSSEGPKTETTLNSQEKLDSTKNEFEVKTKVSSDVKKTTTHEQMAPLEDQEYSSQSTSNASKNPISSDQSQEGGEWELLLEKLQTWWQQNNPQIELKRLIQLVLLAFCFLVLLLAYQIYGNFLNGLDKVPLIPELLQLTGLIWFSWFSAKRLLRSSDRKELFIELNNRWTDLLGDADKKG